MPWTLSNTGAPSTRAAWFNWLRIGATGAPALDKVVVNWGKRTDATPPADVNDFDNGGSWSLYNPRNGEMQVTSRNSGGVARVLRILRLDPSTDFGGVATSDYLWVGLSDADNQPDWLVVTGPFRAH
jgi:hypothetical protein